MAAANNPKLAIHPSRAVPVPSAPATATAAASNSSSSAAATPTAVTPPPATTPAPAPSKPAPTPNLKTGRLLLTIQSILPNAANALLSKVIQAEDAIRRDPFDVESWLALWNCAASPSVPLSSSRIVYEQFLLVFPTASRYWKQYIEEEMNANNYDRVEKLFMRCLLKCLDLDLWKTYIRYIKLVKSGAEDENRALEECYEFVLRHMGTDLNAADVWIQYINFLKTAPARNTYEEGQKTAKIRKIYQRSLVLPIVNVELLWRDYDQFEHKLNKALAKGLLGEYITRFTLAKAACRERKRRSNGILFNMLARPAREGVHTQQRDYQQVILWRRFIRYERSNPLNLEPSQLRARVIFSYKQALLTVRHYPEIWYEYALYVGETGTADDSVTVFHEALSSLPYSLLMAFLYADWEEERKAFKSARAVYESLLPDFAPGAAEAAKAEEKKPAKAEAATSVKKEPGVATAAAATAAVKKEEATSTASTSASGDPLADIPPLASDVAIVTADGQTWILPQPIPCRPPATLPAADPLAYIQFMRFIRRTEGIDPARKIFILARKSKAVTYHSYVAAALMEYQVNNQPKVASKIFTLGMNDYQSVPAYVCQYLDFLAEINDHNNMRVIFERVLNLIPAKDAADIWSRYIEFERNVGDLSSLVKLETRRATLYGRASAPKTSDLVERYRFLDRYPVSGAYRETIKRSMAQFRDVKDRGDDSLVLGDAATMDPAAVVAFKSRFARPVLSGMIEFQVGEREVRTDTDRDRERERVAKLYEKFVPDSVRTLQKHPMLPSFHAYRGAYIDVPLLMELIAAIDDSKLVEELNASIPTKQPIDFDGDGLGGGADGDSKSDPAHTPDAAAAAATDSSRVVVPLSVASFSIPLPGATRPPAQLAVAATATVADGTNETAAADSGSNGTSAKRALDVDGVTGMDGEAPIKKMKVEPATDSAASAATAATADS